ncbi:hypothetical protein TNCV_1676911 [Trichonephila clavipes]|nr:hypothetical protein TNCV_1676911 [Trichonephila clavipes]
MSLFFNEESIPPIISTCAPQKHSGIFSSDIAPTTDGREKNTTPSTSGKSECNSMCKRGDLPPPNRVERQSGLKHSKERLCLSPPSLCRMGIANNFNNL